jgi:hypothetical protein
MYPAWRPNLPIVPSPYKGSPGLLCDEFRCPRYPTIIKLWYSHYHNAEEQNCTLPKITGNGIWKFSESIHDIEQRNCKDLMWLETATVVMTLIFGVADRIISGFTVSGIAINRRIQISRGPTSVMSSCIISVIFSKVFHRHHHFKVLRLVVTVGTHPVWLQYNNRLKHPNISHYLHETYIKICFKK